MGRIARVVAAKYPHHVTRRGNRRQDTFFCEEDELLIHRHEQTGRPLGNIHFIKRLENKLVLTCKSYRYVISTEGRNLIQ
jgi:putative transposase